MTPRPDRLLSFARSDYAAASAFSAKSFWRAVTANVMDALGNENPESIIERNWLGDENAKAISRAVKLPATTTSADAQALVPIAITNILTTLAPAAAATRLH